MSELKCSTCAVESTETKDWARCPECESIYCEGCVEGVTEEAKKLKALRDEDSYSRITALCPSCNTELIYF